MNEDGSVNGVPEHATIKLSTPSGADSFVAEYNSAGESKHCKAAEDGIDVFVSLSRHPIGTGRMTIEVIRHIHNTDFDSEIMNICQKTTTPVVLWDGPSDGDVSIVANVVIYGDK